MVPESKLEKTEAGVVAAGAGWFVLNARDARWIHREGRGAVLPFTGWWEEEAAEAYFPQFGVTLFILAPGEPMSMYHGEEAQEDFLVLRGPMRAAHRGGGAAVGAVGLRPLPRLDRAHDRRCGRRPLRRPRRRFAWSRRYPFPGRRGSAEARRLGGARHDRRVGGLRALSARARDALPGGLAPRVAVELANVRVGVRTSAHRRRYPPAALTNRSGAAKQLG